MTTFTLPEEIRYAMLGPKMTGLNASLQGGQSSLLEGRLALIVRKEPELQRQRFHVEEWYVSPGLDDAPNSSLPRRLERGWHRSAEPMIGSRGQEKDVLVDLSELPREFDGVRASLTTYVPRKIYQGGNEVRITPDPSSFRVSPDAPAVSGWCLLYYNGTFHAVDRDKLNEFRKNAPQLVAFPWINENPAVGPMSVYGDAGGQALQVYYPPDFPARTLMRGDELAADDRAQQDGYLWAHNIPLPEVRRL